MLVAWMTHINLFSNLALFWDREKVGPMEMIGLVMSLSGLASILVGAIYPELCKLLKKYITFVTLLVFGFGFDLMYVAIQYAGKGIRCNATCPGATDTGMMNEEVEKQMDQEMWSTVSKHQCEDIKPIDPIDQAYAILFLASDEARLITGQILVVDAGRFL